MPVDGSPDERQPLEARQALDATVDAVGHCRTLGTVEQVRDEVVGLRGRHDR
jgi:hypothetical protein